MVATLVIHGITWITTHLPTPEGWKSELAYRVRALKTKMDQLRYKRPIS